MCLACLTVLRSIATSLIGMSAMWWIWLACFQTVSSIKTLLVGMLPRWWKWRVCWQCGEYGFHVSKKSVQEKRRIWIECFVAVFFQPRHFSLGRWQCGDYEGEISDWNVGYVEDMAGMFARSQFNKDISRWNWQFGAMNQIFLDCILIFWTP